MQMLDLQIGGAFGLAVLAGLLCAAAAKGIAIGVQRLPPMLDDQWRALAKETLAEPLFDPVKITFRELAFFSAVCMVLGFLSVIVFGAELRAVAAMILGLQLVACSWIDVKTLVLPDVMSLPLMWQGLLLNVALNEYGFTTPEEAILGAAAGYVGLWTVGKIATMAMRRDAMGYGDMKFLAAIGAWIGLEHLVAVMIIACVSGIVLSVIQLLVLGEKRRVRIPFGPHLAIGAVVMLGYQAIHRIA
jgi:prepilin signal peptidase PulO-like enzyme (type II secretory pathway)